MGVEEILSYRRISERIASSGQPEEHEFKAIAQAGYQVVVNLAMPNSDRAIPEEGNLVTARGMSYVHIPVPFEAPAPSHLLQFLRLMKALADRRLWIHCVLNHRVSAFIYQYERLALGRPHEEALAVMLPSWSPNDTWRSFMALTKYDL